MKISELTENDVIRVDNERELKTVWKLLKRNGFTFNDRPMESPKWFLKECWSNYRSESSGILVCSGKDLGHCRLSYYKEEIYNIIPASKFLNQSISKKDLQEALSKVGEELSSMNERLGKLEAKREPKTANGIEIDFDEVTEGLPEKWCVGITSENKKVLLEYWRNLPHNKIDSDFHGCLTSDCYDGYWCHWGGCFASESSGYTEITFETFKKYVLKEEVKEAVELETGKWYKQPVHNDEFVLFCYNGKTGNEVTYGFNTEGNWSNIIGVHLDTNPITPATESEVFEALKAEAEKRGFNNPNIKIQSASTSNNIAKYDSFSGFIWDGFKLTMQGHHTYQNTGYSFDDKQRGIHIFQEGNWATIIDQPEPIDFSKAGQFFISQGGTIVQNSGEHSMDSFTGTLIHSTENNPVEKGNQTEYWDKRCFTLCTEPITLQN